MIRNNHAMEGGCDGDKEPKRGQDGGDLSQTGFTVYTNRFLAKKDHRI